MIVTPNSITREASGGPGGTQEQARLWRDPSQLAYHLRQFDQPYASTRALLRLLGELPLVGGEALDVACGAGANICHMSRAVPGFRWTGVDLAADVLFPRGQQELTARGVEADLVEADLHELDATFPRRRFDLVISTQTLSWLPTWEAPLAQMIAVSRGWIVISSLFTDCDAEATIQARDLSTPDLPPYYMNVYNLARVRAFCERHGCSDFRSQDFEIDVDLPSPDSGLGTYTRMLADGRRLQFTGPVYLPWKFVAVRCPSAGGEADRE